MSRKGPRPHTWKYQDPLEHVQNLAWLRMKAQAVYRHEPFELTFEQFKDLWRDHWHQRGRASDAYCLSRRDPFDSWRMDNVECVQRIEHLARQGLYRQGKK